MKTLPPIGSIVTLNGVTGNFRVTAHQPSPKVKSLGERLDVMPEGEKLRRGQTGVGIPLRWVNKVVKHPLNWAGLCGASAGYADALCSRAAEVSDTCDRDGYSSAAHLKRAAASYKKAARACLRAADVFERMAVESDAK